MQPTNLQTFGDQNYVPKVAIREQLGKSETSGFLVPTTTNFGFVDNQQQQQGGSFMGTSSGGGTSGVSGMLHNLQAKLKSHTTNLGKPRRVKAMHRDSEERFRTSFESLVREPILFEQQCKAITTNRIITGTVYLTPNFWCFSEIPSNFTGPQIANRVRFILPLSEVTSIQRGLIVNPNETVVNVVPTPSNFDPFAFRDVDNLVIQLFDKQGRVHEFCDFLAFSQAYNTLWFVWNHKSSSFSGLNQPSLVAPSSSFVAQPLPPPVQVQTVPTQVTTTIPVQKTVTTTPVPPPPPMPPIMNPTTTIPVTTIPPPMPTTTNLPVQMSTMNTTTSSNIPIPPPMPTTTTTTTTPRTTESLLDLPPAKLQEAPYK